MAHKSDTFLLIGSRQEIYVLRQFAQRLGGLKTFSHLAPSIAMRAFDFLELIWENAPWN